jgi:hypothetical protein
MKQKHRLIWQRRNPSVDMFGYDKMKEKFAEVEKYQKSVVDNPLRAI